MTEKNVFADVFWHDGRGPELDQVHYGLKGTLLEAIDYTNPDGEERHILFLKPQVFMFTPEEVENYLTTSVDWSKTNRAAIVCLEKSPWLLSFNQRHLEKCRHFRLMFYDDFLDVICEDVLINACKFESKH